MANTTVTFRTDETLKKQASDVFEALGMNLSVAINLFLKQAVEKQMFPCSLELNVTKDMTATYPAGFFALFGSGRDLGLDVEPEELPFEASNEKDFIL